MEGNRRTKEVTINRQVRGSFLMTVLLPDCTKTPVSILYIHLPETPPPKISHVSPIYRVYLLLYFRELPPLDGRASDILRLVAHSPWPLSTGSGVLSILGAAVQTNHGAHCLLHFSAQESWRRVSPPTSHPLCRYPSTTCASQIHSI